MKKLVDSLIPKLSDAEHKEMIAYLDFTRKYQKELRDESMEEFSNHPVWGPIIKNIPPQVMQERQELSDKLQDMAIRDKNWEPYVEDLIQQGAMYANMGLDFKAWFEIVSIYRKYMAPFLYKEYGNEPSKITYIISGMDRLLDIAMAIIGEAYIYEKRRTIEEQKQQQEGLNKELESFAFIISHDLKTPLRGIANLADWISNDYADKLDETGQEYLSLLKNRVGRLESLIDGVLNYSRAGRKDSEVTEVDLNQLIKDVVELNGTKENTEITIDNTLPVIKASLTAMQQVFSNLISNAIKYNDKPKAIIHIGCQDKGSHWQFYVADNGPGIDPQFHEKVFQIFQTLQTKDEVDSTGIGLTIVKKIVENSRGKIWIESEGGKGTTFNFTIPK